MKDRKSGWDSSLVDATVRRAAARWTLKVMTARSRSAVQRDVDCYDCSAAAPSRN